MSTIAAIATPNAAGGIGIIRISGERAIEIANACFAPFSGKPLREHKGYTAAYGAVFDQEGEIDDGVAIVYRAPKSYTGEDVVELCCHGGLFILQKTLRLVYALGAVPAEAGEFTKRAFLNGKMDLSQAESVMNLISAQGEGALKAARNTLKGNVSRKIDEIAGRLIATAAALAAWADYPDEDIPAVENRELGDALTETKDQLSKLLRDYDAGLAVTQGVKTVICGKPNVGKSTLMNLLSGFQRSIVTDVSGTTRDVIEETVRLGDVVLRLADTAGIHETDDLVETIGVNIAREKIEDADLVICVFDGASPLSEEDYSLAEIVKNKKSLAVINKADLENKWDPAPIRDAFSRVLRLSAKDDGSLEPLRAAVEEILGAAGLDFSQEILAGERQRACCENALNYVSDALFALSSGLTVDAVNVDIDCAVSELLTLTGKRAGEEIVNEVFRRFCVGK